MSHTGVAYPRAALVGNPSDGYGGKTIAFAFSNFQAEVKIDQSDRIEIVPGELDRFVFASTADLVASVREFGYYGGARLLTAAVKVFADFCTDAGLDLGAGNFTLRHRSSIPRRVGLGGSSGLVLACLRALMAFFDVGIEPTDLANLALEAERGELDIPSGLQDRVAQTYGGLVYMDFGRVRENGAGAYTPLDSGLLPPVYVAYKRELARGSEVTHRDLRARYERGDPEVVAAMDEWSGITDLAREAIERGDPEALAALIDRNFDLRCEIGLVDGGTRRLAHAARSVGASANSAGSGGAIVGTCRNQDAFGELSSAIAAAGGEVLGPTIAPSGL